MLHRLKASETPVNPHPFETNWNSVTDHGPRPLGETAGFFGPAFEPIAMSALRDALRDLQGDVFFDLLESDDAYLLVVDLPGVTASGLEYEIEDGIISIDGHLEGTPVDEDEYEYVEDRRPSVRTLSIPLGTDVGPDDVAVSFERGVLELTIPKSSDATTIDVVEDEGA